MPTAEACPACDAGLIARRPDPLCPGCVKAARELAPRPLWLFDSPLLRQALADVNLPAVLAIVRAACGLSQRDLAMMTGWSAGALSCYERGRRDGMFDIRSLMGFADAIGMPRAALLPLVFADPDAGLAAGPGAGDGMDAVLPVTPARFRVNVARVRYWRACAQVLQDWSREAGGTVLLRPALQLWQPVQAALRDGVNEAGGQCPDAAAEVALSVGAIARECGRLRIARSMFGEARSLATHAESAILAVRALAEESQLCAGQADAIRDSAQRALRLALQAQDEGRYLAIPRLHAMIALRHAAAASLLGDKPGFQNAISRARHELCYDTSRDEPRGWMRSVSETGIGISEAQGYLNLGEHDRAALTYRRLLATGLSARDQATSGAGLASALLMQGAPGDAVSAAAEVLPALETGAAPLSCLHQLRAIGQAASGPGTAEFRDRLDAIERRQTGPLDSAATGPRQLSGKVPA